MEWEGKWVRTEGNTLAMAHTRKYRLETCIAVVPTGLLTNPNNACNTSMIAKLCTTAVWNPTLAYVVVALLSIGTKACGNTASTLGSLVTEGREELGG